MDYKSLDEIRDSLNANLPAFLCIGRPKKRPCQGELENQRKSLALELLAECTANLTRQSKWDIIALVLCATCQKTYTQKKHIRCQWGFDTPGNDHNEKRCQSPYSLYSKSPDSDHRRSSGVRLVAPGQSSASRGRSSERSTPSSPTEAAVARRRVRYESSSLARSMGTRNNDTIMTDRETEDIDFTSENAFPGAASSQPYHAMLSMRESESHPFSAGETSTWAPWTLRHEVIRLVEEPLPKPDSRGSIYAVEVTGTPYVKIGITTRDVRERLKEIRKRHGQGLRIGCEEVEDDIPLLQLYRLERLVHADLAFFQRNLTVQRTTQRRTHREYFEVDLATAMKTIRLWLKIMQTIGLDAGSEIDQHIKTSVRDWIRDIDAPPVGTSPEDYEVWKTVNANHELRHKIWSQAFKLDDGGFKKRRVDRTVSSLTVAALALCFLYSSNLPDWVKDVSALFFLTAGALYTMDTGPSDGCITWVINTSKTIPCFVASMKGFARLTI